jgi:type II secretory pathway component GspD/PulD (secretin)
VRFVILFFGVVSCLGATMAQTAPADPAVAVSQASGGAVSAVQKGSAPDPLELIPVADSMKVPVLDFKNTDIRDVLRAIGMQYNVNIYLEPEVKGPISLYLTDIKVKNAIDFIVKRMGYAYIVENGIVKVFKNEPPPPAKPAEPAVVFSVKSGLLTVDLKNIPAERVARLFTDSAGMNVVLDGTASKDITSHLVNVDVKRALKVLFESNGYDVKTIDDVHYVSMQNWSSEQNGGQQQNRRLGISLSKDKRVSMEVDDAPLDQTIRTIAVQSGINIFIYDKLSGSISAKCDSLFIDDAFRFLLQNTKYTFWKDRGIYFIGSQEMSEQKTTLVIPLRHIMAEEAKITKVLPPNISKNAVIKFDNEHNTLIVIGSFDVVAQTQEFIDKIDKPVPQVLIEALVVDFNLDKIREFGVTAFTGGSDSTGSWTSEQFLPGIDLKPGRMKTAEVLNEVLKFVGIDKIVRLPKNFRSSIQALETSNIVKVHSTPQIATINGNPASITIGETRYYKLTKETKSATITGDNVLGTDERFEVLKFNTQLEVTPWVMDGGYVTVKIRPEFNIPRAGGDGSKPPNVDTRVLESMVRLKDGQTIVLGGQRQTENVVKAQGVPFLSSIPILGVLFSHRSTSKIETQMMIFLTPHVYYGDEGSVSPDDYFGKEINRILDKYDPDAVQKRREERKLKRQKERELRDSVAQGVVTEPVRNKREGGIRWPWFQKKNVKPVDSSVENPVEEKNPPGQGGESERQKGELSK